MANASGSGSNLYLGKGRVYADRWVDGSASGNWRYLGDVEKLSLSVTTSTIEKESSTEGAASLIAQDIVSTKAECAFTMNEFVPDNIAMAIMGSKSTWSQTLGTATDQALGNAKLGCGLSTGKRNITVTGVKKGSTVLVAATNWGAAGDYYVDADAGIIFIFDTPATAGLADGDALTWSGSWPAVTSKSLVTAMTGAITLSVMYVSATDQVRGPRQEVKIHKMSLSPEGAQEMIGKEYGQLQGKGGILKDSSQPAGQEYWVQRFL